MICLARLRRDGYGWLMVRAWRRLLISIKFVCGCVWAATECVNQSTLRGNRVSVLEEGDSQSAVAGWVKRGRERGREVCEEILYSRWSVAVEACLFYWLFSEDVKRFRGIAPKWLARLANLV